MIDKRRLATAAVTIGLLGGTPALTACEAVEERTGLSKETQMGAGAGAAAGGVLAGIAGANPGWIAASAILGGVAGGAITEYLNKDEVERHASTQYTALNTLEEGESRSWENPQTGHHGRTTVTEVFTMADGTVCKNFTETVDGSEGTLQEKGTACKGADGEWKVRNV